MNQAVGLALEVFGLPAIAGGLAAAVVAGLGSWLLPARLRAFALPAALAIGFFAGYLCLPRGAAPLLPQQSWQWLPYVGVAAMAIGGATTVALRSRTWLCVTAMVVLALLTGGLVTPHWPIWGLTWPASTVWLSLYVAAIAIPLMFLPERWVGRSLVGLLAGAAAVLAVAVAALVSIRLAQLPAIAAAGLLGCQLGLFSGKCSPAAIRGLIPVYATLVGGAALIAGVEPDPPLAWLLAVPILPLAIWLRSAAGRQS